MKWRTSVSGDLSRLFEPVDIAGLRLPNRLVMAPMSRYFCPDGIPHAGVAEYYRKRVEGGIGLVLSEATYIDHPSAECYEAVPRFHGPALEGWKQVIDTVHAAGGKMFPQLWHVGSFRQPGMAPDPSVPGLGPSENTNPAAAGDAATRALTEAEIADIIAAYAQAAADAKRLGFDGVELHGAHGYLLDEFLWERTNRRTDDWGGDHVGRTRFPAAVIAAVRAAVGPDFPVSMRWSQWKQQDYRVALADTPETLGEILRPLADAGLSILHCSTRRVWEPAFPERDEDRIMSSWVKELTGLPTISVGGVGLEQAGIKSSAAGSLETLAAPLNRGEIDLLAVGRAVLADPNWPKLVRDGRAEEGKGFDKAQLAELI
ncbi:12-oxophytodienoate reductase [Thalassorhabdomicrobium marinisediminis]|uniref:12-oxophytodienoate reductase n=1 Tax=Thalassorhabdomicrobium marinisediminis TaxID=2170577 RepID=A0A2T7FU95_9RHOB|nr:12-oxophytodienoate reductase [Thalassorhabdomicrobium marinisediminis]PVA05741.1 12-oxophytodienoate reductase [Thalassorhabdomicrobium marinisediminis]